MRVFIELPTWLGDCVMATAAIESIVLNYPEVKFTFFGSFVSINLLKNHPNCEQSIIDESKKAVLRASYIFKTAKQIGKFDAAISFRSSLFSLLMLKFLNTKQSFIYKKNRYKDKTHQVEKYISFVKNKLNLEKIDINLKLNFKAKELKNSIGINPGATYGSAKRWYPEYFAKVVINLRSDYEFLIFGGKNEIKICNEIAEILEKNRVNFKNLCGQTNLQELCEYISALKLFITNDSGPMHIAAAFKVPTIALFGPTNWIETSPWQNKNAKILRLNLKCQPCMKRTCPLKTHDCMKNLEPEIVLKNIKDFI